MSVLKFPQKAGAIRTIAYNTLSVLNAQIEKSKGALNKFQFLTRETSLVKDGKKVLRGQSSHWKIVGIESPKKIEYIKKNFVMPGQKLSDNTEAERLQDVANYTGKKGVSSLKKLLKARKKLGTSIMEKEIGHKKYIRQLAVNRVLSKKYNFNENAKNKVIESIRTKKRIELRAKGYTFRRINGRIVPIKVSK